MRTTNAPLCLPSPGEAAILKVRMAEDAWNSRDPRRAALAYSEDSHWRNRSEFLVGRDAIVEFLTRKWAKQLGYRLHHGTLGVWRNPIAV